MFRSVSIACDEVTGTDAAIRPHQRRGLESVKKTHQVVDVGTGFGAPCPSP